MAGMAPIQVRSTAEAREYMMLALSECGDRLVIEPVESVKRSGEWVDVYVAGCADQDVRREFEFTLDPTPLGGDGPLFGAGTEPSKVVDAGEWYLVASRYLQAGAAGEEQFQQDPRYELVQGVYENYAWAGAALLEVLKFIPPAATEPPDPAFWTERGRSVREQVGDQLRRSVLEPARARLEGLLQAYREAYQSEQ
jgi:hypothetical protein